MPLGCLALARAVPPRAVLPGQVRVVKPAHPTAAVRAPVLGHRALRTAVHDDPTGHGFPPLSGVPAIREAFFPACTLCKLPAAVISPEEPSA